MIYFLPVEARYEVPSSRRVAGEAEKNGDGSDGGPPAALRKWQRQRPREEYTFESDDPPYNPSAARQPNKPAEYAALLFKKPPLFR